MVDKKKGLWSVGAALAIVSLLFFVRLMYPGLFVKASGDPAGATEDPAGATGDFARAAGDSDQAEYGFEPSLGSEEEQYQNFEFLSLVPVVYHVEAYRELPLTEGEAFAPRVSPDGSRIVFLARTGGKHRIMIAEMPSGRMDTLATEFTDHLDPSWSADGKKIVFSGEKGSVYEVYIYHTGTKTFSRVTRDPARKKSWPRFSPYPFDNEFRVAYTSEERGRKDIWWVRESGEQDQPITLPKDKVKEVLNTPYWQNVPKEALPRFVTEGGDAPEWESDAQRLLYRGKGNQGRELDWSPETWWRAKEIKAATGISFEAPNALAVLRHEPMSGKTTFVPRDTRPSRSLFTGRRLTSPPSFFPDGRGFAYTFDKNGKSTLAIEPFNDPVGDIWNLYLYEFRKSGDREKLARNRLLFRPTRAEQIYDIYDRELYRDPQITRPYLVTSDAVLETFYAAFSALLGYTERREYVRSLDEFAVRGAEEARRRNASKDIQTLFLVGHLLMHPEARQGAPKEALDEVGYIEAASGPGGSLFGQEFQYGDFFIRGKYERDKDLQSYFRALKWFGSFKFDLTKEQSRKTAAEIVDIVRTPSVREPLERIRKTLGGLIGESRYYDPTALSDWKGTEPLPTVKRGLPWITVQPQFAMLPAIYTLDSYIFGELTTHANRPETVGTPEFPRVLPTGLDVFGALGSPEAQAILLKEMNEGRYANYEKRLKELPGKVGKYPAELRDQNIYTTWLGLLDTLVKDADPNLPDFAKAPGWKRKQLNTALGSWVNLRYETIGYVEQEAAEGGEGGFEYERIRYGKPRGYVEPNPLFFRRLDEAFGKMADRFRDVVRDAGLRKAMDERIGKYRIHLKRLESIASKELKGEIPTDEEYTEILYIGRTIEHFKKLMDSVNPPSNAGEGQGGGLSNPDSMRKVVDVQAFQGARKYVAIGHAHELNVVVPYFGRRQVVHGPVYSYHEFISDENWNNERWQKEENVPPPAWLAPYYEDAAGKPAAKEGAAGGK